MIKKKIFVRFTSCWSAGSGFGDGYVADSMVLRDSNGFPAISGRALKGALREGAHRLSQCREDLARAEDAIFGTRATARESNDQGSIRVSAATLPESIRQSVSKVQDLGLREDMISDLFCYRINTALTSGHQTKTGSLRTTECGIPGIEFEAELEVEPAPWMEGEAGGNWLELYMGAVAAAVKSIGADRARGLGQCKITLADDETRKAAQDKWVGLPPAIPLEKIEGADRGEDR